MAEKKTRNLSVYNETESERVEAALNALLESNDNEK